MKIDFEKEIFWSSGLEGVGTWAIVDGKRVGCVFEGRAIAEYFGAENRQWPIELTYLRNRTFMEEIVRDAIERGMVDERNELLLGKRELTPYFEKRAVTAPA